MANPERLLQISSRQSDILRLIARDSPLPDVLAAICLAIEGLLPGARSSILRRLEDGARLGGCVAPSMGPGIFLAAANDIPISQRGGSCGAAALTGERVITPDVATDPRWQDLREIAAAHHVRACWSEPVLSSDGAVIGTLAVYCSTPYTPNADEIDVVCAFADLTSLALRKEERRTSRIETEQRLSGLTQNLPGTVFQWKRCPSGRIAIMFISDGIEALTGLPAAVAKDHPMALLRLIGMAERRPLFAAIRRSIETFEPFTRDIGITSLDGQKHWVRLMSSPRREEDGQLLHDALALDISDRQEAEARLRESRAELNERVIELHRTKARLEAQSATLMEVARELTTARDMAEEASRSKSEFLSNMTHELRTPLNAIIGFSEIIKNQTFGPVGSAQYRTYAHDIHDAGRHLLELINEILDYAKLESGRDQLLEDRFPIDDVVDSVVRMMRDSADRAKVRMIVHQPDRSPVIQADKRKLRQILINLVSNAIKFTERGGSVTLNAWCRAQSGIVFQVVDTGIGMELDDIPKALGVFGQIDSAFSRSRDGTGLGLPLTKALCEMHGGSFDLQSKVGVGTTATVRLPPERIIDAAAPQAVPERVTNARG